MRNATALIALLLAGTAQAASWDRTANGVTVSPDSGPARLTLSVHGDGMVHVVAAPAQQTAPREGSLMVPAPPAAKTWSASEANGLLLLKTTRDTAEVNLKTGRVRFLAPDGSVRLGQSADAGFKPVTVDGKPYVSASAQFNRGSDEAVYGLGQHQQGVMNQLGEDVELAQHNMEIAIPFIVSTKNYGLLWDNDGISRFGRPAAYPLLGREMAVTSGGKPGFTARYYLGSRLAVERQEATINYQFIRDQKAWPEEAKAKTTAATAGQNTAGNAVETQRVEWSGEFTPAAAGLHRFQLYGSSYYRLSVNGKVVLDRWRQNWNPWFANADVELPAGKPVSIKLEWEPNAGYMALFHANPEAEADRKSIRFTSDVARAVDYWYVPADSMDGVVAGLRQLTGKAELMPKWAYGFWQSRQRYNTQDELLGVVREYRRLNIPLDAIVQDWFYWREDDWGSHRFDPKRFPDPQAMVDEVHKANARIMISVWPKFYPTTDNYKEFAAKGLAYQGNLKMGNKDWVGPGYANTDYDPYSAEARAIYWRQVKERLADYGFDAWWLDATEPDMHSNLSIEERIATMGPTARGPGAEFFNSFPLVHAEGVVKGWRELKPDVRPFILTRSGFGGIQRTNSALWSGDVASRWFDLGAQISAGVNLSLSGVPNWTHDIGGFALEDRFLNAKPGSADLAEWQELNLRWFQFGAMTPLFRSHGEPPHREIFEISPEGSPMRASMVWYTELRYRMLPWVYSLAAGSYWQDGSMMRAIAMDFPDDRRGRAVTDQYLFGHDILVAPVVTHQARTRDVWLPGTVRWADFTTGQRFAGGQSFSANAPFERMPMFVREGAIIPMGPVRQHVADKPGAPITLHVYTGANGQFALYEDDGESEAFRNGAYSRVAISYDDKTGTLSIGARDGKGFKGMPASQTFHIRWETPGRALELGGAGDQTVSYKGEAVTVKRR
jgi:alpha-D-xyloside xylohydrolase